MATLSPMMQQYLSIKEAHKDHIVFFRLGDFYEMFFDDALLASKELELTLTGRDCGLPERAPMCSIPFHSSEAYIQRLLEKGYKVAICEQTELPQKGKALVNRDVIRVVTPGTIMENSMLAEDKNNYIASIYIENNQASVCFCDISTGSMRSTVIGSDNFENNLKAEVFKYMPKEIIINSRLLKMKWLTDYIKNIVHCSVELIDDAQYNDFTVDETVKTQFKGKIFTMEMSRCLWQLLNYLSQTQKVGVEKLDDVDSYSQDNYMKLSYTTTSNLELFETIRSKEKRGSLLWVLDNTKTSFGKRMLRKVIAAPLMDKNEIDRRLDAVEYFNNNPMVRMDTQTQLKNIQDMERLCTRAGFGNAGPRDVFSMSQSIKALKPLKDILSKSDNNLICDLNYDIDPLESLGKLLDAAIIENPPATIKDGGIIKDGFDSEVDHNRHLVNDSMEILAEIENRLRQETNIPKLKVGYNRVFGYYIEVTRSYLEMVPDNFIRKQTLAGAERYVTEELKNLEAEILNANEKLLAREKYLYGNLLKAISDETDKILRTTKAMAYIDILAGFSQLAQKNNYVKPVITDGDKLYIK
ncbi:MAG: DNA mismatch repair protein MutS, partial [Oscillospiraceae bacterium]|nr:DNA mismatch repair protein MutS [Oscillospiraceae bacterium]